MGYNQTGMFSFYPDTFLHGSPHSLFEEGCNQAISSQDPAVKRSGDQSVLACGRGASSGASYLQAGMSKAGRRLSSPKE